MTDANSIFNQAQQLMQVGRQNESIELLRKAASLGHIQASQIVDQIEKIHNLTKRFPMNPLNIVDEEDLNRQHIVPNLVTLYKDDIGANLYRLQTLNNGLIPDEVTELLIYQTIDNLLEYRDKSLGVLPLTVVSQISRQIIKAFREVYIDGGYMQQIIDDFESGLMIRIWEEGIVEKTKKFIEKLDDKYFI